MLGLHSFTQRKRGKKKEKINTVSEKILQGYLLKVEEYATGNDRSECSPALCQTFASLVRRKLLDFSFVAFTFHWGQNPFAAKFPTGSLENDLPFFINKLSFPVLSMSLQV